MSDEVYYCENCGNKRYFYNEVSVMAIQLIDNKQGKKHNEIIDADVTNVTNYFEPIYCYECGHNVA